ncbi:hypothetical protein Zmor_013866 [Zophobas morio]|uniref:Uncharacterized protein n=1 Tax=Zophobas morio TaxID=2755281 RepID=A0AA38IG73_9CUCU|nr:hypothetical protein Zmor_013866 [Zophobas morio]
MAASVGSGGARAPLPSRGGSSRMALKPETKRPPKQEIKWRNFSNINRVFIPCYTVKIIVPLILSTIIIRFNKQKKKKQDVRHGRSLLDDDFLRDELLVLGMSTLTERSGDGGTVFRSEAASQKRFVNRQKTQDGT